MNENDEFSLMDYIDKNPTKVSYVTYIGHKRINEPYKLNYNPFKKIVKKNTSKNINKSKI